MFFPKIFAVAALALIPIVAHSAILVDGTFEAKSRASGVTNYCNDGIAAGGNGACSASAWAGSSGVVASGSSDWGDLASLDGGSYAYVQLSGALLQSFTASSTGSFSLSWLDAGRSNQGVAQSYKVELLSDGVFSNLGTFTTEPGQQFVARESASFLLKSGMDYRLSFTGLSNSDNTSFIDSVAITAIPEPATWTLLISGFAMTGIAMRRRKFATNA